MRSLSRTLACCCISLLALPLAGQDAAASGPVPQIRVQPDKAPDCTSLKTMVESATRGCTTNDAKAIAIYNFMELTHYHREYPESSNLSALKEITNYGWSLCGGLHATQSALWRQLGWNWRFVGWSNPGHTTVEAEYDGRWHYFDVFLKFYAWMPDGKGGRTIAGQDDLKENAQGLLTDAFILDKGKNVLYMKDNPGAVLGGQANWRAPSFLSCGDPLSGVVSGVNSKNRGGSPEGWGAIKHADGDYTTDVNLAPGTALTNTWDAIADAWTWPGHKTPPGHTCPAHKDTRNDPGIGLVLEPYISSKPCRGYANGMVTFAPDLSSAACLQGFASVDNVSHANKALAPTDTQKPAVLVVHLSSPYNMTKACGVASGADTCEVSVDGGKAYAAVDIRDFTDAVKGKQSALVRITFKQALTALKLEAVVQNNPGALPYLSPGANTITVSVGDAQKLRDNRLVVTYAYRLGSRTKSYEQLCEQGKEIAKGHNASWSEAITYVRKTFTAKDLPATFTIDCPTPKGQHPVYPRMVLLRREILAPGATPLPLPEGASEAKPADPAELLTLPNPFLIGTEAPPVVSNRPTKTLEFPLHFANYANDKGETAKTGPLNWPKNDAENGKVIAGVMLVTGDLAALPTKDIAAARICVPVLRGHASAQGQLGAVFLRSPIAANAAVEVRKLPDAEGTGLIPKQPADTKAYSPAKVFPIDVTRAVRAIASKETTFNGVALRMVPNRSVDEGYTVRCEVSPDDKIVLQVDVYTGP